MRKRSAQASGNVYVGSAGPFHVCEGEAREYPLVVEIDKPPLLTIDFSEDGVKFGNTRVFRRHHVTASHSTCGSVGKATRTLTRISMRAAPKSDCCRKTTGGDVYSVVPRAATATLALAVSTASSEIVPRADTRIAAFSDAGGDIAFKAPDVARIEGAISTSLKRSASFETKDISLWSMIRRGSDAVSFDRYLDFMNWIFCGGSGSSVPKMRRRRS